MMKNIWGKITAGIVAALIIFMVVPFIVAVITSTHIIDVNTESQWIGFCGNYLGALIGGIISGGVTLYVLFRTIKDNQKTLYETLENTNNIEKNRIKREFASWLIEKISVFFTDIQKVLSRARYYVNESKEKADFRLFINDIYCVRSILWEIKLQVALIRFDEEYIPLKADEIHVLSDKLIDMLADFGDLVEKAEKMDTAKGDLLKSKEDQIVEYSEKLMDKIEAYSAKLIN